MLGKLNFKIKFTICLHTNFREVRLKRKTNQENKQRNKKKTQQTTNNKGDNLPTQPIFLNDFSQVVYLFLS